MARRTGIVTCLLCLRRAWWIDSVMQTIIPNILSPEILGGEHTKSTSFIHSFINHTFIKCLYSISFWVAGTQWWGKHNLFPQRACYLLKRHRWMRTKDYDNMIVARPEMCPRWGRHKGESELFLLGGWGDKERLDKVSAVGAESFQTPTSCASLKLCLTPEPGLSSQQVVSNSWAKSPQCPGLWSLHPRQKAS